jgi:hypothetical protein
MRQHSLVQLGACHILVWRDTVVADMDFVDFDFDFS